MSRWPNDPKRAAVFAKEVEKHFLARRTTNGWPEGVERNGELLFDVLDTQVDEDGIELRKSTFGLIATLYRYAGLIAAMEKIRLAARVRGDYQVMATLEMIVREADEGDPRVRDMCTDYGVPP